MRYGATQCVNVVVGIGAVKGGSGGMEEILAVNKHRGALDWRLSAHAERKNNPARGLSACPAGRKSRATIPARQTDVQAGRPVQRLTTGSRYVRPRSPRSHGALLRAKTVDGGMEIRSTGRLALKSGIASAPADCAPWARGQRME